MRRSTLFSVRYFRTMSFALLSTPRLRNKLLFLAFLTLGAPAAAQPGTLDLGFDTGVGFDGLAITSALQPDGRTLIGGMFTTFNDEPCQFICRLMPDGQRDTSFHTGIGFGPIAFNRQVNALALQPDGKILVGGLFETYAGSAVEGNIVRLFPDGTLDTSFNAGPGANTSIQAIALYPDGRLAVGGFFSTWNGDTAMGLIRLHPDGSVDTTLDQGTGLNSNVRELKVDAQGRLLVAGAFQSYNGEPHGALCRLLEHGEADPTFQTGTGFSSVVDGIQLLPDGRILVCGSFNLYNGMWSNRIQRLLEDGTPDPSFNIGSGANTIVQSVLTYPDGRFLAVGYFVLFNGMAVNHIVRVLADGTPDPDFQMGSGFDYSMRILQWQPDEKILVAGACTSYNGVPRNRIARLNSDISTALSEAPVSRTSVHPNPTTGIVSLSLGDPTVDQVLIRDITGRIVQQAPVRCNTMGEVVVDLSDHPHGLWTIELRSRTGTYAYRVIKE